MNRNIYAIIGGDDRFWKLAELMAEAGETVFAAGFDMYECEHKDIMKTDAITAASMAENIILPIPPTKDGVSVNAPYSSKCIRLDSELADAFEGANIYTGFAEKFKKQQPLFEKLRLYDYSAQESFLMRNAHATAEAAVMLAIEHMPVILAGSKVLIAGCGRIGKYVIRLMRALGADVYAASRSLYNTAYIHTTGAATLDYKQAADMADAFDLVINTADAMVITEQLIRGMKKSAVIIDLASYPGGTDFAAAEDQGIKAIHALGLPGKYSPHTAAEIILNTIIGMKKEE